MTSNKIPIITNKIGQYFRQLPSARRTKAIETILDMHRFMAMTPGENYANEVTVLPSGPWVNILLSPPAPLQEVVRITAPRPTQMTVTLGGYNVSQNRRFRGQLRLVAVLNSTDANADNEGRYFIEWGVGKSRNYMWLDLSPGTIHIPNAEWLAVSAWTRAQTVQASANVQLGGFHGVADATWTIIDKNITGGVQAISTGLPPFARNWTCYYDGTNLNDVGEAKLFGKIGPGAYEIQTILMRPPITPNPGFIPFAPNNTPLPAPVGLIGVGTAVAVSAVQTATAVVTIRI